MQRPIIRLGGKASTITTFAAILLTVSVNANKTAQDPDLVKREQMVVISRQLGVTCTHCHDPNDYGSRSRPAFGIASDHMRVVSWLNSKQGFAGKPKVDCYLCHRGEPKPQFREPAP